MAKWSELRKDSFDQQKRLLLPADQPEQYCEKSRNQTDWSLLWFVWNLRGILTVSIGVGQLQSDFWIDTTLSDDLFHCCCCPKCILTWKYTNKQQMLWCRAKSRLYWSIACHSSKFCIGFGHVLVEVDFGSVQQCPAFLFCSIKTLFQKQVLCLLHTWPYPWPWTQIWFWEGKVWSLNSHLMLLTAENLIHSLKNSAFTLRN